MALWILGHLIGMTVGGKKSQPEARNLSALSGERRDSKVLTPVHGNPSP